MTSWHRTLREGGHIKAKRTRRRKVARALSADIVLSPSINERCSVKRLRRKTDCCEIRRVVMRLPSQVLCYSQSIKWWECVYLLLPGFTLRKHRGGNQSLNAKITPSFNQSWEEYSTFVFVYCSVWLTDNPTASQVEKWFCPVPLNYMPEQFMEGFEEAIKKTRGLLLVCTRKDWI